MVSTGNLIHQRTMVLEYFNNSMIFQKLNALFTPMHKKFRGFWAVLNIYNTPYSIS